jgi:carbon monoxide dehydrogenase subunit G
VRFAGWSSFAASRAAVWTVLADPARLVPCLPVRVPVEQLADDRWRAAGRVGNGWLATTVQVDLELVDVEPDRSLRIRGHGGASGTTVDGWVAYALRPGRAEGPTVVDWEVDLALSGGFAAMLSRVVEQRGPEELDRLVACLKAQAEAMPDALR